MNLLIENLEKTLLKNWTSFIDIKFFTEYIISLVKNTELQLSHSKQEYPKGIQIKLSKFTLTSDGFIIWAEFNIPNGLDTIIGTSEIHIKSSGEFEHTKTIGTLIKKN